MRILELENINAAYGDLQVLFDVSLHINKGEVISLVGSNGAGKTTILRIISGITPIISGQLKYEDQDLLSRESYERASLGIAHVPQGRGILGTLTVKENLILGAYNKDARQNCKKNFDYVYSMFPILYERQNQKAGSLSGGQQQMLSIARALMMEPNLLLLDEPSLGLAPIIVEDIFNIIEKIAKRGTSIFVVEQNLIQALSISTRGYVLENGKICLEGSSQDLINNPEVRRAYLGV